MIYYFDDSSDYLNWIFLFRFVIRGWAYEMFRHIKRDFYSWQVHEGVAPSMSERNCPSSFVSVNCLSFFFENLKCKLLWTIRDISDSADRYSDVKLWSLHAYIINNFTLFAKYKLDIDTSQMVKIDSTFGTNVQHDQRWNICETIRDRCDLIYRNYLFAKW